MNIQPLIFNVEKQIWLATTGPLDKSGTEIIGWTSTKPPYDNGSIDKGAILTFVELSPEKDVTGGQPLEFMIIHIGSVPGEYPADFNEGEIDNLIKDGALELLDTENVDEISIVMRNALIKYPKHPYLIFDTKVISPRDLYITMGPDEMLRSNAKITTGEKISLKHLLEVYSTAVGQNIVSK